MQADRAAVNAAPPRAGSIRAGMRSPYPWIALGIALAVTIAGAQALWHEASTHARQDFERRAQTAEASLRARLAASEHALVAGAAFLAASKEPTRAQWGEFVARLKLPERSPGLQAMGFAERVRRADRERHVKRVRAEGLAEYDIRPPGERDDYVVIAYVEPYKGRNARTVGLDTYSQPVLRTAIDRAFERMETAISEKVAVPDDEDRTQPGFVMYVPAFRAGMPLGTPAERDAALLGFVFGTFRANEVAGGALDAGLAQDVGIAIYDGPAAAPERLLIDLRGDGGRRAAADFRREAALEVGGRRWTALISSDPRLDARASDTASAAVVAAGFAMSAALFYLMLRLVAARSAALDVSIRDPATQLFNFPYLEETMRIELQRAKRASSSVGLVLLDIDGFKKIGDSFGAECADRVLKQFALLMEKNTRDSDIKCRVGGSEFAVGMPGASIENAKARADRLREVLESLALECGGKPIGTVTLSAGVAVYPQHGEDWGTVQRRAHRALYAAKEAGRNRVALAE